MTRTSATQRLDERLVSDRRSLDLEGARRLIASGSVLVDGAPARSPARRVSPSADVAVLVPKRYVSRGADKLTGALEATGIDVADVLVLDVGASTGGFTDVLLERGARRVLAVDVGRHQLHERLRADPRVVSLEETNVLDLTEARVQDLLGGAPGLVTVDVAFTSVTRLVGHVASLASDGATLLVLVKPQFEADRAVVSRGRGVVTDPGVWRSVLEACASATEDAGAGIMDVVASPLAGTAGNREFFVAARKGAAPNAELGRLVEAAVEASR